jgi:hypothetical protein
MPLGVVGGDFGDDEWAVFKRHNINTDDIEIVPRARRSFGAAVTITI